MSSGTRGSGTPLDRRTDREGPHRRGLRRAEVAVDGLQQKKPPFRPEGCGLERLNYGLASEGKTRWCAGCGGGGGGGASSEAAGVRGRRAQAATLLAVAAPDLQQHDLPRLDREVPRGVVPGRPA